MQIPMQQIRSEGLERALGRPDPLAQTIYNLYSCDPAETLSRRVVVLTRAFQRRAFSTQLDEAEACQLLWDTLHQDGRRVGEVVYDCPAEEGDYVLHWHEEGYRLSREAGVQRTAGVL